jgi:hypothetical protein
MSWMNRQLAAPHESAIRIGGMLLLLLALVSSAGCSPKTVRPDPSGNVSLDLIAPEPSTRMQLQDNQVFIPGDQTNPEVAPVYPPQLLPLRLPEQVVCASFVVNRDGSVANVTPLYGTADCPAHAEAVRPEFVAATIDAVSRWDFFSFQRCTFPPGTPEARRCNGPGTTVEPVAVTLAYRFMFSAKDGGGVVRATQAGR